MKKKKDEYLVYNNPSNNADFYYKNGKLHREAGPAIVINKDIEKYSNLSDKKLYVRVNEPVVPERMVTEIIMGFKNEIEHVKRPWKPDFSFYFLEGKPYTKEEHAALVLEKELSETSSLNQSQQKTKKLKI
jgi:hypothetical protein